MPEPWHVAVGAGVALLLISTPFIVAAIRSDPDLYPPILPLVQRSASATFSLPNVNGVYQGELGKVTYSITSRAIVPDKPLDLVVTVELPMLIAAQWEPRVFLVSPDNAVVEGWPTINGSAQAQIVIPSWATTNASILVDEAWIGNEIVNFTSEGFVGGVVEIIWVPASWDSFDWAHMANLTDLKFQTTTSLAILSPAVANAPLQSEISSAWNNTYANAILASSFIIGGVSVFVYGLFERKKGIEQKQHDAGQPETQAETDKQKPEYIG